jgi:hypothetical protein
MYYRDDPPYREPVYRVESYRYERDPSGPAERWDHDARAADQLSDECLGISLPVHMI